MSSLSFYVIVSDKFHEGSHPLVTTSCVIAFPPATLMGTLVHSLVGCPFCYELIREVQEKLIPALKVRGAERLKPPMTSKEDVTNC